MIESSYYYAIRISRKDYTGRKGGVDPYPFLARQNASAPALFWFHEDAIKLRRKCEDKDTRADIVKVYVRWSTKGKSYNKPGDMFRSGNELRKL